MLIPLQEKDFDQYIDFAYELDMDPVHASYIIYYDGIKTKEDFIAAARKAFDRPGEQILLYQENGQTEGWIHYYFPEEDYLAFRVCCIRRNTARAMEELSAYLTARYSGCDWTMGFPASNTEAVAWLESAGFHRLEDSNHYHILYDQYVPVPEEDGVERITEETFEKFQRIHRTIEGDMYWNCRRVREDLDRWDLFVAEEDGVAGEAMVMVCDGFYEIFALGCEDGQFHEGLFRRLLRHALNEGKKRGASNLTFFVDPGSEEDRILPELGFQLVGRYFAYQKRI